MIIVLKNGTTPQQQQEFIKIFDKYENLKLNFAHGTQTTVIGLIGDTSSVDIDEVQSQDVVDRVTRISEPYKKVNRKFQPKSTVINVGNVKIGGTGVVIMAGPCSVESEEQVIEIAGKVKESWSISFEGRGL